MSETPKQTEQQSVPEEAVRIVTEAEMTGALKRFLRHRLKQDQR